MRDAAQRLFLCAALLVPAMPTTLLSGSASADPAARVDIGGLEVPVGVSVEAFADALEAQPVTVQGLEGTTIRSWAALGATIDRARLASLLSQIDGSQELSLDAPVRLDVQHASPWLLDLKRDNDRTARSARIDVESGEVVPEQDGLVVDVWASLDNIRRALAQGRSAQVVSITTGAHRSADSFEGLEFDALLGQFETPYNGSGEAAERTHNLRVAAAKVDGVVLFPGEEFDFNGVVGERSLAEGFRPATVIAGGELVDGVGGGACRIAGTLHAAAFFAGLEISERHPHSRPSSYIKLGLDAAVSYPNLNFRFRNDRDTPVLVRLRIQGGKTIAQLYGDVAANRVQFIRRIDEFVPFEERTVEDDSVPTGVRFLSQRGVPGFVVRRYRMIEDANTRLMVRETSEDEYPPTTQVWRVGTGGAAPDGYSAPAGDTHREYTADEFTIMTQGVGIEGTTTTRRQGRTGVYGWTVREGMPPAGQ